MISNQAKEKCILESKDYFLVKHPDRVKQLGEVFTPTELVLEILDQLPDQVWEQGKTYLDPTCGNGQFLASVLLIKQALGYKDALSTIYGVDIMRDNVQECKKRLLDIAGWTKENIRIVHYNIRCENGLTYDYSFTKKPSFAETLRKESISTKEEKPKVENITNTIQEGPLFGSI